MPKSNIKKGTMQKPNPLLSSQSKKLRFEHLTVEQGLSNSSVMCNIQDSKGFLWFGTFDGLNRYDGYNIKVFENDSNDSSSLSNNHINYIYEDKTGILWIGTNGGGLNKFIREKEQFTHYKHDPDDPASINCNYIWSIFEDSLGVLWIGTGCGGLKKFNREKEQFRNYKHNPEDPTSISNDRISSIYEDKHGELWIGTKFGGLNKFDREKEQFIHYKYNPDDPTSIGNFLISVIYEDNTGIFWIGTHGGGLYKFDREKRHFFNYSYDPNDLSSLTGNDVYSIYEDSSNNLWIGTIDGGLNKFDREKEKFIYYQHNPDDPTSLSNHFVLRIFEDNSRNLWIGTWGGGLNKYDKSKVQFQNYSHNPNDSNSINNNYVTRIYEDSIGNLWLGTDFGLNKYDCKKEQYIFYQNDPNDSSSLSSNFIYSICEDNSGNLWIGNGKLDKFDKKNEIFIHYNKPVQEIYEDKLGMLWLGIYDVGLSRFDRVTEEFILYKHDPDDSTSLCNNYINIIFEDKAGMLWIGTQRGLDRFDREKEIFYHYKNKSDDPSSLSSNRIYSIYEDKKGNLWIGTNNGLNRFDKENEVFVFFTEKDGLPNNNIYGILADDLGNLWLSTGKGLSKFNTKTETIRNYDVKDGLQSNEFNKGAYFKSRSGEMFFGGVNGFTVFHPVNIKDNPHIPPIVITDFQLLHKSVPVGFDKSNNRTILEKSITETKEIELNYEDNVITFEFAALDFHCPEKNKYAYMMEGFNKDWIYTDASRRYATYTNLDPGEYTFRVKGSNNDGIWNEEGTSLKINILPEMRSRFFADISHEFRTPLTLILGPLKQIIEETKDPKTLEEATLAEKSAERLNVLVNQLMDLSRVVTGNLKLQTCAENIVPLLKGLTLSFASLAERKNITLKFKSKKKVLKVFIDKDKVEKIVTNILSNAFKFTEEGGKIDVNVQSTNGTAEIRISDTGIGIPKEKLDKIFDRFYQVEEKHKRRGEGAGIGLALTKELVELHKGEIQVESEEGKGTTFTVSIPLGREHLLPEEISEERIKKEEVSTPSVTGVEEDKKEEEELDIDLITETEKPLLLIVEDNADVRTYIRGHLDESYRISEAVDGKDGMDKVLEYIPDLVVSDVMMPKMDGFELCGEIKKDERTSHIPVILLTAKAASEDKIEGLETGADDYIMKPFDAKELQVRIKNLIEQRKKLRERFNKEATIPIKKGKYSQIDEQFLKKAMDVIEKHISEPEFSLDEFGRETGMSRTQLHRKVRALTDHSPHNFIRFIRLKHAAELLIKGAGNVTEIAYDVGFSSLSHFAKAFKEQFGKTPSDYIKAEK